MKEPYYVYSTKIFLASKRKKVSIAEEIAIAIFVIKFIIGYIMLNSVLMFIFERFRMEA